MPPNKQRSSTLRKYQGEIAKVSAEVQAAFLEAEDALTALEDREGRRAARTPAGQARLEAMRSRNA